MLANPAADARPARSGGDGLRTPGILDSEDAPRLVRIANVVSALVVAGFATLYIFEGPTSFIGPNFTFSAIFVALAIFGRDPRRTVVLTVLAAIILLGIQLSMLAGIANGITVWFLVPNVAALLIGIPALSAVSLTLSIGEIVAVAVLADAGILVPVARIAREDLVMVTSFVAALLLCAMFAHLMHTARRQMAQRLEASNDELRTALAAAEEAHAAALEAAVAKDRFFANVTHEIRTPLNGIAGTAELLHEADLPPEERELVDALHASTRNLVTLVNEMLSHARLQSGRVGTSTEPVELARLAGDLERLFAARARERDLGLVVRLGPDAPAWIRADGVKLRQVASNLVGNALKFTLRGRVEVILDGGRAAADAPVTRLLLVVTDTGPGIAAELHEAIFEPFVQADAAINRPHGGTGLGLAIARSLAELMGGTLTVASRPGEGATFTLDMPAEVLAAPVAAASPCAGRAGSIAPRSDGGRPRVLVAEDNPVNRAVAARMLERLGAEVAVAEDGGVAIDLAGSRDFELVLMDLQMPGTDGITAARAIRARETATGRHRVRIVAMTGNALEDYGDACAGAGMDGFLTKPVEIARLRELLDGAAARMGGGDPPPAMMPTGRIGG